MNQAFFSSAFLCHGGRSFGGFEEEVEAAAEFSFAGEEGMKTLTAEAIGVVAVAASGDGLSFAQRPTHPTEVCLTEHFRVEVRHFRPTVVVRAIGNDFVSQQRLAVPSACGAVSREVSPLSCSPVCAYRNGRTNRLA